MEGDFFMAKLAKSTTFNRRKLIFNISTTAILSALGAVLMIIGHYLPYPIAPFLKLEPSDTVVIVAYAICGFPSAFCTAIIKTLLDFLINGPTGAYAIGQIIALTTSMCYVLGIYLCSSVFKFFKKGLPYRILSYVITIDNQKTTSKNITVNVKQKGNTNYEYVYVEPNYSGTYYNQISDELRGKDLLLQLDNLLDSTSHPTINFTYKGLMSEVFPYTDGKDGKLYAFYRGTLASSGSMNREHVWPNSRGGNYVERDPHMVRPTLTSDNSGRENAFYNESGNYDPGEFGAYQYRGICARIIFYCAVKAQENGLNLVDKNTDSTSNKSMGKLSTLLKWNLESVSYTHLTLPTIA